MKIIVIYVLIISIIGVVLTIIDKEKARNGDWRISEKTLFIFASLGGSLAMYVTMNAIHHKTKKKIFMVGFPLIAILQIILIMFLFQKFLT